MQFKPGTFLKHLLTPVVWVLRVVSRGRLDYRECEACCQRKELLDRLFAHHSSHRQPSPSRHPNG
jgi:hypothetical protein